MTKTTLSAFMALCTLMSVLGCKSQKAARKGGEPSVLDLASETFQSGYEIVYNRDSTHALVTKEIKTRPNQIFPTVKFFVYAFSSGEKIHRGSLSQGKVRWINHHELLCESIPGRVSHQESGKKYIYDVQTQSTKPYKN